MAARMTTRVLPPLSGLLLAVVAFALAACAPGGTPSAGDNAENQSDALCAAGATVEGIDVSEFQGNIDWGAVKASGRQFAVIRVADGHYFDPKFNQNWSGAASVGMVRGVYQFFRGSEDGTSQADFLLSHVQLGAGDLPPVADVEVTDGVGPGTLNANLAAWVSRIQQATGKTPIIYTSPGLWGSLSGSSAFAGETLWVANWGVGCPGLPPQWSNWKFWQYADNGGVPGIGGAVDLDRFNGSLADLQAFAGGGGGSASNVIETAFQANTTDLWTTGNAGTTDWHLGMMPGTSPSICALAGGGFEVAFQANTTELWTAGNAGITNWHLGMQKASSPSIACLRGGGFEVAFEANTTSLWTVGNAGNKDWGLGMMSGTSPSITPLGDGFEVAFEANTTDLWTVGTGGNTDWHLGMYSGTSPSITAVGWGFQVAFQANTTDLWTVGIAGNTDWHLGMMPGTNPSIAGLTGGGFEVAFQANTTDLWTVGNAGNTDWHLGMMKNTSPAISARADGSFKVDFQANTGSLWRAGDGGTGPLNLGMMGGSSPSGT